jgi:hypothetical protein
MSATLLQKLNKIYKTVDHIEKNGWNEKQKYKFVRAADLAHAVRNAFADAGIYAEVNFEYLRGYEFTTTGGSKMQGVDVKCDIVFHDMDGDTTTYRASGIGSGSDGLDKAAFKAQTGALKYALRNAFIVPDEADPENDSEDEPEPPRKTVSTARPKEISKPKTEPTVTTNIPVASGNEIPPEDELEGIRNRYELLGKDLSDAGLTSKGMKQSSKRLAYLLKVTGAKDAKSITRNQWNLFFEIVGKVKSGPGIEELVRLVEESANQGEQK